MTAVADYYDRTLVIGPNQIVKTDWVSIDICTLGNRTPMSPEAVEKAYRRLLNQGDCGSWPPINGQWANHGKTFVVHDGRHEFIASLMRGAERVFVAWVETQS